jgi:transcriptional regulator with XRE-family HTH domain
MRNIDAHVATQIRRRRHGLGLTQFELGERLGLSHQAVHKLESGETRVTVARLWDLAGALEVPIGYFFFGWEGAQDGQVVRVEPPPTRPEGRIRLPRAG